MKKLLGMFALVAALATPFAAHAVTDPELDYRGLRYACTGLAAESRDDPRWQSYSTKLVFAAAEGAFLADIAVTIVDETDLIVLEARCFAPWLLVDLQPGRYRVEVVARQTYAKNFDLEVGGARQLEHTVRFPEITN